MVVSASDTSTVTIKYLCGLLLSCLWDGAYKRTLPANRRVAHVVVAAGFLARYLSGPLPHVRHHITVYKMYWVHR